LIQTPVVSRIIDWAASVNQVETRKIGTRL